MHNKKKNQDKFKPKLHVKKEPCNVMNNLFAPLEELPGGDNKQNKEDEDSKYKPIDSDDDSEARAEEEAYLALMKESSDGHTIDEMEEDEDAGGNINYEEHNSQHDVTTIPMRTLKKLVDVAKENDAHETDNEVLTGSILTEDEKENANDCGEDVDISKKI